MAKKSAALTALDYLADPQKHPPQSVNVIFGDEMFLRRQALRALSQQALAGEDSEFSTTKFAGRTLQWRDISDELMTVSLFGAGRRLVIVEEADDFVSNFRKELEDYVAKPSSVGTLVLIPDSWPKNTRLYKALASSGLQIDCAKPKESDVLAWLRKRSETNYGLSLSADAAKQLVEIIGCELGLLEQELDKLSLMAGDSKRITPTLVRDMVGGWRAKTAWEMLDAAYDGNSSGALVQLERLILAGEHPISILAQISSSLRRFAAAARIVADAEAAGRRINLRGALEQAGVNRYFLDKSEKQLRRIGRQRASQLYGWLMDADLALKGASSAPLRARLVLEKLLIRLASPTPALTGSS